VSLSSNVTNCSGRDGVDDGVVNGEGVAMADRRVDKRGPAVFVVDTFPPIDFKGLSEDMGQWRS